MARCSSSSFEYLPNLKPGSITLPAHYMVTSNEIEKQNQFSRFVFLLNSCQLPRNQLVMYQ
jgi:hypothetical protein